MTRRLWFLGSLMLITGGLLAAAAGIVNAETMTKTNGFSVGADGYQLGTVTLSRGEAYIGDTIGITGTGHVANAVITVYMGGISVDDGELYLAKLGETTSDSSGKWSYVFTVPQTCTRISDGATIAISPGEWPVGGVTLAPDTAYYGSWSEPDLLVYGYPPAPAPASGGSTLYYSSTPTLPSTGMKAPPPDMALITGALLCAAGLPGLAFIGRRRRLRKAECASRTNAGKRRA